jgi:phosphatidylglycerophosphate synthase
MTPGLTPRRVLATRDARWARGLARWLGRAGVRPNSVSLASIVFAAAAGACFVIVPDVVGGYRAATLALAAAAIQCRLLCNLLDGMLAVEEGFRTKSGDIYNELPDRIADVVILTAAGYALRDQPFGVSLGWLAAVCAVLTAYVRLLGGSLRVTQHFSGPMAKPHRMFTLTIASLAAALESLAGWPGYALPIGLVLIGVGSVATLVRRTQRIAAELEAR